MLFMNEYDIEMMAIRHFDHPILGPATRTLDNLREAANDNSDGWCYWPKPARAAKRLMELIRGDGSWETRYGQRDDVTAEALKAAYGPIKAFRTRSGLDFTIVDADPIHATPDNRQGDTPMSNVVPIRPVESIDPPDFSVANVVNADALNDPATLDVIGAIFDAAEARQAGPVVAKAPKAKTVRKAKGKGKPKVDVYAAVTERIIAMLEEGTVAWHQPWDANVGLPLSMSTRRPYRGINPFLLAMAGLGQSWSSPFFGTYKRISALGGQVRKGEHSSLVVLWRSGVAKTDEVDDDGEDVTRRWATLRQYPVFNACQADGLDERWMTAPGAEDNEGEAITPIEAAAALTEAYYAEGPTLGHGGNIACYSPGRDHVQMPSIEAFVSAEAYHSTLFHETTHSTGHASRLDRPGIVENHAFGTPLYSKEELVAEVGAAMMCGLAGIDQLTVPNSAAYVANWLRVLGNEPKMVVQAAAAAQKAVDLITGVSFAVEDEEAA